MYIRSSKSEVQAKHDLLYDPTFPATAVSADT